MMTWDVGFAVAGSQYGLGEQTIHTHPAFWENISNVDAERATHLELRDLTEE